MKQTPQLLAGVIGFGTLALLVFFASRTERQRATDAEASAEPVAEAVHEPAPEHAATPQASDEQTEATARESLVSAPVEDWVAPEAGVPGVVLLRWPDEAPLANVSARVFGNPGPRIDDYETSKLGRIDFADALANERIDLSILVDGFEAERIRVGPFTDRKELPRILLRPTTGWFGRVRDYEGQPVADVQVTGWWIEAARPYAANERHVLTFELELDERAEGLDVEPVENAEVPDVEPVERTSLVGSFVAARGLVAGTTRTNDEGWFYIEPLGAEVHGQLSLTVEAAEDASSDILRVALPTKDAQLPDLILHRPLPVYGSVVDTNGDPIVGAVVVPQFAQGWSKDLPTLRTDEVGRFELVAPSEPLVVTAEKVGYRMVATEIYKSESLDGLWRELAAFGLNVMGGMGDFLRKPEPLSEELAALAALGYGNEETQAELASLADRGRGRGAKPGELSHAPRRRYFVPLDAFSQEARIVLSPLAPVTVKVIDAERLEFDELEVPIEDARILVRYGGLDRQTSEQRTNAAGIANFAAADVEWQPVAVTIEATGYVAQQFALGRQQTYVRVELVAVEPGDDDAPAEPSNGLVLGPDGPVRNATVIGYRAEDFERRGSKPAWSLQTDAAGEFTWSAPEDVPLTELFYLFAFAGEGRARVAGKLGPLPERQLANDTVTVIDVAPAVPLPLDLYQLESGADYRINVSFAPFPGGHPEFTDEVFVHATDFTLRGENLAYAPYGWQAVGQVDVALVGNAPLVDFVRGPGRRRQHGFKSLETVWTDWERISDPAIVHFVVPSSVMQFSVAARVDFGGSVYDRPWDAPDSYVAARGTQGQWIAPVDGNGWFDFCDMPSGTYELVLYSPPDPAAGFALDSEGQVFGLAKAFCRFSRYDIVIGWVEPPAPGPGDAIGD